ncbi:hypothetical protein [Acinetobacter rudis]|uniref:hypothetical protein n=1 Tax=Acinetobacter rudis TaxID=632955 RepID=UPI00333F1BE8
MKQYYVVENAQAPVGAESIVLSEKDKSLGKFGKYLNLLVDIDVAENKRLLNQCSNGVIKNIHVSGSSLSVDQGAIKFIDGRPYNFHGDMKLNVLEHSVFAVVRLMPKSTTTPYTLITSTEAVANGAPLTEVAPNFSVNSDGLTIGVNRRGGINQLTSQSTLGVSLKESILNKKVLLSLTFSVMDGYKCYLNGKLIGKTTGNMNPLSLDTGEGEWQICRAFIGDLYANLVVDRDMSKSEADLNDLHQYFLKRYKIV